MKQTKIKGWAVVGKSGKIKMETFYLSSAWGTPKSLAIFPFKKIDQYSPLWGYALGSERVVEVQILLPQKLKPKKKSKNENTR